MARQLDHKESFSAYMHEVGTCANVCYVFFLSADRPITAPTLQAAMRILANTHPLLRMHIQNINETLHWKEMEELKMDIRVDTSEDWHSVFQAALAGKFDVEKGPLWSLVLMPNAESEFYDARFGHHAALALRVMHAIADGQGLVHLMNDLQDLLVGDQVTVPELTTPLQVPKPLLEFANPHMSTFEKWLLRFEFWGWLKNYFIRPILNRLLPAAVSKTTTFEKFIAHQTKCDSVENATTGICFITVNGDELDKIHRICKQNNVTMTSACEVAGNMAMCELIREGAEDQGVREEHLGEEAVIVAAVYRNRLPDSDPDRCNYLADHSYALRRDIKISEWTDVSRFWELANQTQTFIRGNFFTSLKENLFFWKQLNYCMSNPEQFVKYFKPEKRWFLLGYTNHGNCNFLNRGPNAGIKIGGMLSGVGGHYYGGVMFNHIVTLDNKMIWNVNYATNLCDRALADKYLHRCVAILKEACHVK